MARFDFDLVRKQPKNDNQITLTVRKARTALASSKKLSQSDPDSAFTLAYDSMLKNSLALMLSKGYRPRAKLGHHKTLIEFARYSLGKDSRELIMVYDRMRRKRNKVVYDVASVSEAEISEAIESANAYCQVVTAKIEEDNPQMKLF